MSISTWISPRVAESGVRFCRHAQGIARFALDVSTPGKFVLALNSAAGIEIWIDKTRVKAGTESLLELNFGIHQITLLDNLNSRKYFLACELRDVAGSPAQVQIVNEK